MWNNPNDPTPIKTMNMAGLQKWEETDDYIIYLDKDAVMTTVANYVTGTYDLFLERKADIDGAMELLRANDIEWTAEDDSKLILDINKAQLERIANTPTTMEEEDFAPQTFTTRAVPTTYECCFRVDKKTGEIYIGEGYENLWRLDEVRGVTNVAINQNSNHYKIIYDSKTSTEFNFIRSDASSKFNGLDSYTSSVYMLEKKENSYVMFRGGFNSYNSNTYKTDTYIGNLGNYIYLGVGVKSDFSVGDSLEAKHFQITKTSTPKPFVKSVMPSGKLAFVTEVNETTHTFLNKGDGVVIFENGYFSLKGDKIEQFLVYNALLTEQEKQAELAKDIKLATNNTQMHTQI